MSDVPCVGRDAGGNDGFMLLLPTLRMGGVKKEDQITNTTRYGYVTKLKLISLLTCKLTFLMGSLHLHPPVPIGWSVSNGHAFFTFYIYFFAFYFLLFFHFFVVFMVMSPPPTLPALG